MVLKLKLQYFGHLMWRVDSLEKTLMLGGIGGRRRTGRVVWSGLRELGCGQDWLIPSLLPFLFSLPWHGLMVLHAYIIMGSWLERKVFSLQSPFRKVLERILISLPRFGTSHCSQICEVLRLATPIPPSLGLQGDPTSPFWRRLALRFLWKEWC